MTMPRSLCALGGIGASATLRWVCYSPLRELALDDVAQVRDARPKLWRSLLRKHREYVASSRLHKHAKGTYLSLYPSQLENLSGPSQMHCASALRCRCARCRSSVHAPAFPAFLPQNERRLGASVRCKS